MVSYALFTYFAHTTEALNESLPYLLFTLLLYFTSENIGYNWNISASPATKLVMHLYSLGEWSINIIIIILVNQYYYFSIKVLEYF